MAVTDQLKELKEVVYKIKKTLERVESNQEFDRKDFSEFQNRLGHLEVTVETLKDRVDKIPGLTQDKVAEALQPMIDSTDSLSSNIEEKKVVEVSTKKKRFWFF